MPKFAAISTFLILTVAIGVFGNTHGMSDVGIVLIILMLAFLFIWAVVSFVEPAKNIFDAFNAGVLLSAIAYLYLRTAQGFQPMPQEMYVDRQMVYMSAFFISGLIAPLMGITLERLHGVFVK